jgi:hypothetical protein
MNLLFQVEGVHLNVLPMRTRFPFRYGIAALTWVPHVFLTVDLVVGGKFCRGLASEGLAPKWFTKRPEASFEEELAEMVAVIQNACRIGRHAASKPRDFASWWKDLYTEQASWAKHRGQPGLLAGLGVSLVERAVLDGLCRAVERPLHQLLRAGELVPDLGVVRETLSGVKPADYLPAEPVARMKIRHTVGLGDWLVESDIPDDHRVDDGLPQSLEACLGCYGLSFFKIKLAGDLEWDRERLRRVLEVVERGAEADWMCTLDGNEGFDDLGVFLEYYTALQEDAVLREMLRRRVLFVEQPLRRERSLAVEVGAAFKAWREAPVVLIDEADGDVAVLPQALALGYAGVSHKNCKGIVKGLANAATIWQANGRDGGRRFISGEDLAGVGPVAVFQDLAMQALLGVQHVERNGHHYFRGLSMYGADEQALLLALHPDLLRRGRGGEVTLAISAGEIEMASINGAPFGVKWPVDRGLMFEPLNAWIRRGGMSGDGAGEI